MSRQHNSETWWRRTTGGLLGVSFGSYRRHRRYVPLRRLGDVLLRCRGVVFETCLRRCGDVLMVRRHYIPLRRFHDIPIRRFGDIPPRLPGNVPLRRHRVFHLKHTCDFAGTYREMSLRRRHDYTTTY